ncbi:MAG: histidine kinase dimerization/phosphoacceptor domain -containing protein, partial [Bacteroidota bacterium]
MKNLIALFLFLLGMLNATFCQVLETIPPYIQQLQKDFQNLETDTDRVAYLYVIADEYVKHSLDSTFKYLNQGRALNKKVDYFQGYAMEHRINANIENRKGNLQKRDSFLLLAEEIYRKEESPKAKKSLMQMLGRRGQGFYHTNQAKQAEQCFQEGLEIARQVEDTNNEAAFLLNLGYVQELKSQFDEALAYHEKAIRIAEHYHNSRQLGHIYLAIASLHNKIDDLGKAIVANKKASDYFMEVDDQTNLAIAYSNLGKNYTEKGQLQLSQEYLLKALELKTQIKVDGVIMAATLQALGQLYQVQQDYEKSNEKYLEVYEFSKKAGAIELEMEALRLLGLNAIATKTFRKAHDYLNECTKVVDQNDGSLEHQLALSEAFTLLAKEESDYPTAFNHLEKSNLLKDSIQALTSEDKMNELLAKFEVLEKDKAISLLEKDNQIQEIQIQQQRKNTLWGIGITLFLLGIATYLFVQRKQLISTKTQLEISVKEKETLLKEIHHRVKNNLQLVTSLLNIQAEKEPPQTIEEFLMQGQNRVKSMALIHEQLYRSDNISSINMQEYAENLVKSIMNIHGNPAIAYQVRTKDTHLNIDQAIPLGLIINELVNNCLKHAFN